MPKSDVDQIAAFEQRFARAQATDVIDLSWGFALLQRDFPRSHQHNRIVVTSAAPSAEILSTADNVMSGAGLRYRYISVVEESLGRDLRDDFVARGYESEALTTMIYCGALAGAPTHQVDVVSFDLLRPAIVRDWRVDLPNASEQTHAQLADRTALYPLGAEVKHLVIFEETEIAARVDLYFDRVGGIAQIENLFTHPDYRGRGYAKSLVREGQRLSQDAGCRLCFMVAELDDWPHDWYLRLGYVDMRRTLDFTRA